MQTQLRMQRFNLSKNVVVVGIVAVVVVGEIVAVVGEIVVVVGEIVVVVGEIVVEVIHGELDTDRLGVQLGPGISLGFQPTHRGSFLLKQRLEKKGAINKIVWHFCVLRIKYI